MILSRAKPALSDEKEGKDKSGSAKKQLPTIEQFLDKRDYTGMSFFQNKICASSTMYLLENWTPCNLKAHSKGVKILLMWLSGCED